MFGNEHAVDADCLGGTQEGAEVMSVLNFVEEQEEGIIDAVDDVVERRVIDGRGESDDALMIFVVGDAIELMTRNELDVDLVVDGESGNFFDGAVVGTVGDENFIDGVMRFKEFDDGVATEYNIVVAQTDSPRLIMD